MLVIPSDFLNFRIDMRERHLYCKLACIYRYVWILCHSISFREKTFNICNFIIKQYRHAMFSNYIQINTLSNRQFFFNFFFFLQNLNSFRSLHIFFRYILGFFFIHWCPEIYFGMEKAYLLSNSFISNFLLNDLFKRRGFTEWLTSLNATINTHFVFNFILDHMSRGNT